MKKYIFISSVLGCLLMTSVNASFPNECLELRDFSDSTTTVVTEDDIVNDHNQIIMHILSYYKKIVDIKFETASFLKDNKEIYGKYESLRSKKEYLEIEVEKLHVERKDILVYYKDEVEQINPKLSSRHYSRVHRRIMKQRKKDLEVIDKKIRSFDRQREKMLPYYISALKNWSPYQNYLEELENLELSLERTVTRLSNITSNKLPLTEVITGELIKFEVRSEDSDQRCLSLLNRLREYEGHVEQL